MAEPFKNLYNEAYIDLLSNNISLHYEDFQTKDFKQCIFNNTWNDKELKERMRHITCTLHSFLPNNFQQSIEILKCTFFKMNANGYGLQNMVFQDFVETYGLDDFETSIIAMKHFTIQCSSEFAIRHFILKYPELTMNYMKAFAKDENEHIRRLASEGSRPRLPWAIALPPFKKDPTEVLEILECLKDDESEYVRKSVANNLNDISKDNPDIVIAIIKKWKGHSKERDWILKHGARTLLKSSHQEALALFGFEKLKELKIHDFTLSHNVPMGKELAFSFMLDSPHPLGKLRIEFALTFVRQHGKTSTKVFKISEGIYEQKQKIVSKTYSFKPITTRKYYEGEHTLSILVNGIKLETKTFMLTPHIH